jgi:hypothetical protein
VAKLRLELYKLERQIVKENAPKNSALDKMKEEVKKDLESAMDKFKGGDTVSSKTLPESSTSGTGTDGDGQGAAGLTSRHPVPTK